MLNFLHEHGGGDHVKEGYEMEGKQPDPTRQIAYVLIALVILAVAISFLSVAFQLQRGYRQSDAEVDRSPFYYFQDEKIGTCFMQVCPAPNSCMPGITYVPCTEAVLRQIAAEKQKQ